MVFTIFTFLHPVANLSASLQIATRLLCRHSGGFLLSAEFVENPALLEFGHFKPGCGDRIGRAAASHPAWRLAWQKNQSSVNRQTVLFCHACGAGSDWRKTVIRCIWLVFDLPLLPRSVTEKIFT